MKAIALAAISAYQAHLSPLKGFGCAYRVHTGACSCSALGHRAIRMHGVLGGLVVLRKRMHRCGVGHRRQATRGLRLVMRSAARCRLRDAQHAVALRPV